jgi:hypothetical protein
MNIKTILQFRKTRLALQLFPIVTFLVTLAISSPISAQTVTTFDAPGAGTGASQGTFPFNIAPNGTIIGWLADAGNVRHGFIRSRLGNFTIFDAPNAGTGAGQGTRAYAANPSGQITGWYRDGARITVLFAPDKAKSPPSMPRARALDLIPKAPFPGAL